MKTISNKKKRKEHNLKLKKKPQITQQSENSNIKILSHVPEYIVNFYKKNISDKKLNDTIDFFPGNGSRSSIRPDFKYTVNSKLENFTIYYSKDLSFIKINRKKYAYLHGYLYYYSTQVITGSQSLFLQDNILLDCDFYKFDSCDRYEKKCQKTLINKQICAELRKLCIECILQYDKHSQDKSTFVYKNFGIFAPMIHSYMTQFRISPLKKNII